MPLPGKIIFGSVAAADSAPGPELAKKTANGVWLATDDSSNDDSSDRLPVPDETEEVARELAAAGACTLKLDSRLARTCVVCSDVACGADCTGIAAASGFGIAGEALAALPGRIVESKFVGSGNAAGFSGAAAAVVLTSTLPLWSIAGFGKVGSAGALVMADATETMVVSALGEATAEDVATSAAVGEGSGEKKRNPASEVVSSESVEMDTVSEGVAAALSGSSISLGPLVTATAGTTPVVTGAA